MSRTIGPVITPDFLRREAARLGITNSEIAAGRAEHDRVLASVPPEHRSVAQEVLDHILQDYDALSDILADQLDATIDSDAKRSQFWKILLPDFGRPWAETVARSRRITVPPSAASPGNLETIFMAAAYVLEPLQPMIEQLAEQVFSGDLAHAYATSCMLRVLNYYTFTRQVPGLQSFVEKFKRVSHSNTQTVDAALSFARLWMHSGFAKLEVGQKLAAALALTDVPEDVEVRAPWSAWSLIVPPGLIADSKTDISRLWCAGAEVRFIVTHTGYLLGPLNQEALLEAPPPELQWIGRFVDSLARGCCIALSNPDEHQRSSRREGGSGRSQRQGIPDFSATRFLLSTPVTIDMRPHLHALLTGKKHSGGAPTVQFLVRGHWRNQAHGPRHSLRKQIWVQPFWKGPEESRVLLRNYQVKTEES